MTSQIGKPPGTTPALFANMAIFQISYNSQSLNPQIPKSLNSSIPKSAILNTMYPQIKI